MKKIIFMSLTLLLFVFVTACGNQTPTSPSTGATTPAPAPAAQGESADEPTRVVIGFPSGYLPADRGGLQFVEEIFSVLPYDLPHIEPEVMVMLGADTAAGWDVYFTNIQTMAMAGNAPDVFHVPIEGIRLLVRMGLALPIDSYLDANPEFRDRVLSDIHPNLQAPFVIDGNTYSIVNDWNNIMMHINTQMLADVGLDIPPDDWDLELFMYYLSRISRVENGERIYGFSLSTPFFGFSNWLMNNNTNFLNEDMTEVTFDSPEAIEVLQLFQDLLYVYEFSPVPWEGFSSVNLFMEGRIAMGAWGRWTVSNYVAAGFTDVVLVPLPRLRSQNVVFGSGGSVVFSGSDVPNEAMAVVGWMADDHYVTQMTGIGNIPARRSIADVVTVAPGVPMNPEAFYNSAEIARPVQAPPAYNDIVGIFSRYMSAMVANEMSAPDAARAAAEEMRAALERNPS